jgi:hypothetical protein
VHTYPCLRDGQTYRPIIAGPIDASGTEEAAYSRVVSSEPSPEGEQQRTVRPPPPLLAELAVIDRWILSTYSDCDIACTSRIPRRLTPTG